MDNVHAVSATGGSRVEVCEVWTAEDEAVSVNKVCDGASLLSALSAAAAASAIPGKAARPPLSVSGVVPCATDRQFVIINPPISHRTTRHITSSRAVVMCACVCVPRSSILRIGESTAWLTASDN